jgi:hypothetical protein
MTIGTMEETGLDVSVNQLTLREFLSVHPLARPALDYPSDIIRARRNSDPPLGIYPSFPLKGKWPWKGNGHGTIQDSFTTLSFLLKVSFQIHLCEECPNISCFKCRSQISGLV